MDLELREIANEVKAELDRVGQGYRAGMQKLQSELDHVRTAMNRSRRGEGDAKVKVDTVEDKAFKAYLRRGDTALEPIERKALTVSDDPRGGFLAPAATSTEIIRALKEASPLRRLGRSLETGAGSLELPKQTAGSAAQWVGELEQRPESNLDFGGVDIPLHELATYVDVSVRLLEDAAFNVEDLLNEDLAEAFAAAESTAFLTGNGIKKPIGILTSADLTSVPSGDATKVTGDGLIDLVYSIKPTYRAAGAFLMSNSTAAACRKLKSTDGNYLWNENRLVIAGQPPTLLGYAVEIDDGMPAVAANSLPIVFGAWAKAFYVLNKPNGLTVLRDPYSVATVGKVRFHSRMRVGAALVRGEAIKALKIATS
ncbi:MAG: phage major capsid protein [Geminicoccaceae bacterium]